MLNCSTPSGSFSIKPSMTPEARRGIVVLALLVILAFPILITTPIVTSIHQEMTLCQIPYNTLSMNYLYALITSTESTFCCCHLLYTDQKTKSSEKLSNCPRPTQLMRTEPKFMLLAHRLYWPACVLPGDRTHILFISVC